MTIDDPDWPRAATWLHSGGATVAGAPLLAVLGAGLSQASLSPSRADTTPAAVRAALHRYSTLAALPDGSTCDLADVQVIDLGDLALDGLDNDAAQDLIAGGVAEIEGPSLPRKPDLLVVLGGDNAVTRPAMDAAVTDLATGGLLTLDAHHDVRTFVAGRTNGTPVRGLIGDGLPGGSIVEVGIGMFTNSPVYRRYCDDQGITVVTASAARTEGVGTCVTRHLDALAATCVDLYVDLDVDVLDAAFAAGVHPSVVAVDIVEVDAQADPQGITVDVAAQCLLAAAAGLALRERR